MGVRKASDVAMRAAGIILVTPDGRALFLRRSGHGDHPGEWSIPGGHVEPNEIPVQAALRELQEETGISGIDPELLRVAGRSTSSDLDYTTFLLQVPKAIAPKLNDEHNGHAWTPIEAPPTPTHPGLSSTLKEMGHDARTDKGDTVRGTIKYPAPGNKDGRRAINDAFKRGEAGDEIAPEAAELNATTMDGYLAIAGKRPHSVESFVLQHGRAFVTADEVKLSQQQLETYQRMSDVDRKEVDSVLQKINGSLGRDPKNSYEYRDKLDQLLGRAYVGSDEEEPDKEDDDKEDKQDSGGREKPVELQQAEFPAFLMCAPFALSVDEPDNVWMKKFHNEEDDSSKGKSSIDKRMAFSEWMNLYTYIASRALVYVLPSTQGMQDQVYVANLGLALPHKKDRTIIVANFKAPPRRGEDKIGLPFFKALGYETWQAPKYWEGEAECKYIRDNLFAGAWGIRSSKNTIPWLEKNFDMEIIPIQMLDERLYHLDTLLFPLTREKVITCTEFMTPEDVKNLEKHVEIIDISREDTLRGLTCGIRLNNVFLVNTLLETLHKSHELYEPEVHKKETAEKICAANGLDCKLFNLSEAEKSGADLACHIMHLNWVEGNSPPGSAIEPA